MILELKLFWNNFLDKIKFRKINICKVYILENYRCKNLTYYNYCDEHFALFKKECKMYHLYNYAQKYNCDEKIVCLVEYNQRQLFINKYNINKDYNHEMFEDYLMKKFKHQYFTIDNYIIDNDFFQEDILYYSRNILN